MSSRASLNHIYRTVWNQALGAMVAVAEIASAGGRGTSAGGRRSDRLLGCAARLSALAIGIASAWLAGPTHVLANPAGGTAIVGQASMVNQGNKLTVTTQNGALGNYSAINWQSFSIPAGSTTYFQQPNANSTSINRVVTNNPSQIFGTLGSNGNLVLVNQSGITVGAGAVLDSAGFTASSLRMSDADAMSGRLRFGDGTGSGAGVSVQGSILARSGDVVLIGSQLDSGKDALIQAPNGSTILAAGRQIEITGRGLEGISLQVQAPTDTAINLGTLQGDAVGIFAGTLRHSGLIQATTATLEGGRVVLKASGDTYVEGAGKILATGSRGGDVDVLGSRVAVTDQALIDASGEQGGGTVRVGGDYQGKNPEVQNAQATFVGPETFIKADATAKGDGGKVIVWADDTTRAYGSVSARGGHDGGNGGFVETSGHYLDVTRGADVSATGGHGGTWLLDPFDVTIQALTGSLDNSSPIFTANPNSSTVSAGIIESALAGGTSVIVSTDTSISGSQPGNITVNAPIAAAVTGTPTLTLNAIGNIAIYQPISSTTSAALNLTLNGSVGNSATLAGTLSLAGGNLNVGTYVGSTGTITAGAGTLKVTGGATALTGSFAANTLELATGGSLSLNGANPVTIPTLNFTGGTLNNAAALTINALSVNGSGGTIGGAGLVTTAVGGTSAVTGVLAANAKVWSNAGAMTFGYGGAVQLVGLSGTFNNQAPGTLTADGTNFNSEPIGFGTANTVNHVFNNAGILNKNTATAQDVPMQFNNTGTVNVNSGSLGIGVSSTPGSGSSTGAFNVADGASLNFAGGTNTLTGASLTLNNTGSLVVSGGQLNLASAYTLPRITVSGGVLDTTGDLNLTNLTWSGGVITGSGKLTTSGTSTLTGGMPILRDKTWDNSGTINHSDGGTVSTTLGSLRLVSNQGFVATLNNLPGGVINETSGNSTPIWSNDSTSVFNNAGTLNWTTGYLSGGGSNNVQGATFNNSGTVNVLSNNISIGGLGLTGPGTDTGTYNISAGNSLAISGARSFASTSTLSTTIASASSYGRVAITGSAVLNGAFNATLASGFVPNGESFDVLTATGGLSGSFTSTNLPSSFSAAIASGSIYRLAHCPGVCWDGGASTTHWEDAANWSADTLPASTDVAYLNLVAGVTVDLATARSVKGLNSDANNHLAINSGGSLTLNDAAIASTLLGNLSVSGYGSLVAQGSMTLNGALGLSGTASAEFNGLTSIRALSMSGGTLLGTGDVSITNSFSSSGGSISKLAGSLSIHQASGSLTLNTSINTTGSLALSSGDATISQTGGTITVGGGTTVDTGAGNVTLTASGNALGSIAITSAGAVSISDSGGSISLRNISADSFTLTAQGNIASYSPLTTFAALDLRTSAGAIDLCGDGCASLNAGGSIRLQSFGNLRFGNLTAGAPDDAVVLIAGGTLSTWSPGTVVTSGLNGRWLAYLPSALDCDCIHTFPVSVSAPQFKQYNASYGSTVLGTGNGVLYSNNNAAVLTAGVSAPVDALTGLVSKVYDGSLAIGMAGAVASPITGGLIDFDVLPNGIVLGSTGTLMDNPDVGKPKPVTVNVTGVISSVETGSLPVYGYQVRGLIGEVTPVPVLPVIRLNPISMSGSRVYDGTNIVNADIFSLSGLIGGQTLTLSGSGTVADKNVGVNKPVSLGSLALGDGTGLARNYTLYGGGTRVATITPAPVTASGIIASNKVYDGTSVATVTGGTLLGVVSGDSLALSLGAGSFNDKNVGTAKPVTVTGLALSGADATNYTLASSTSVSADITPAGLTVSGVSAASKVYDGSIAATLSGGVLSGALVGDSLSFSGASGSFNDKNVGTAKPVTVTGLTLGGADAANYALGSSSPSVSADITPRPVSASVVSAASKVYDGSTAATLRGGVLLGAVAGDAVALGTPLGSFSDKNVGLGKTVAISGLSLSGSDAPNYTLGSVTTSTSADITPKAVTASVVSAANKVYDGSTAATLSGGVLSGAVAGDAVALGKPIGAFSDKNVGLGKTVLITGLTLSGSDTPNYTLNGVTTSTSADISKAAITGVSGIVVNDKVYDGKTMATVVTSGANLAGMVAGDQLTVGSVESVFVDRNVGRGKAVNLSNLTLSGQDATNYTLTGGITPVTGNITVRPLSTWTAPGSGQWSVAANWDALPDASNVQAVAIPAGVTVAYDAAVGATQLQSISGNFAMAGGSLAIAGGLSTSQYAQTGGAFSLGAAFNVNGSFSQSGGTIAASGPVAITQSSGNLSLAAISAPSIALAAPAGSIGQSVALVTPGLLSTRSQGSTVLKDAANRIGSFSASSTGVGDIALTSVGPIDVQGINAAAGNVTLFNTGGISTSGPVVASGGAVRMTANSPLTIGVGGISAMGDIDLLASNLTSAGNLTINGDLVSSAGAIKLTAANDFVQNAGVSAALGVTVSAGGSVTLGPLAHTFSNAISYGVNGVSVATPPGSQTTGSTPIDFVATFLTQFEKAIVVSAVFGVDPFLPTGTDRRAIAVEGDICSR